MKKLSKIWQKTVLNLLINHPPPLMAVVTGVFVIVFSTGYWCAHWVDQVDLANYRPYDVLTDNIAGKPILNLYNNILPIDIVYTWVNGSDPLFIDGVMKYESENSRKCPIFNCLPATYLALEWHWYNTIRKLEISTLKEIPGIEDASKFALQNGENTKEFIILRKNQDIDAETIVNRIKAVVGNSTRIKATYWASDYEEGYGIKQSDMAVIHISEYTTIKDALKTVAPDNYKKIIQDCHTEIYRNSILIHCEEKEIIQDLISTGKKISALSGPQPSVFMAKLMIWMKNEQYVYKEKFTHRFEDNEELRYSIRSVEMYAPWVRKIFLVTNGQIPHWLNVDHPKIKIITHEEIFTNKSHLPTFSSPAIESHIHRIPGLSEHFLYLNDDLMFGLPVWPEDFYSVDKGYKVYLSWHLPNCAEGCPSTFINDGYCDTNCNNSKCHWDGGDCDSSKSNFHMKDDEENEQFVAEDDCSPSCSDMFLADSYCDYSCNVEACGYDSGDCGTDRLKKLYTLTPPTKPNTTYIIPKGKLATWMNISSLVQNNLVIDGKYQENEGVRKVIINSAQKALVIVLQPEFFGVFKMQLSLSRLNSTEKENVYHLNLIFNTNQVKLNATIPKMELRKVQNFTYDITGPSIKKDDSFTKELKYTLVDVKASKLSNETINEVMNLEQLYLDNELTEKGLNIKKERILEMYFASNNTNYHIVYYETDKWPPLRKITDNLIDTNRNNTVNITSFGHLSKLFKGLQKLTNNGSSNSTKLFKRRLLINEDYIEDDFFTIEKSIPNDWKLVEPLQLTSNSSLNSNKRIKRSLSFNGNYSEDDFIEIEKPIPYERKFLDAPQLASNRSSNSNKIFKRRLLFDDDFVKEYFNELELSRLKGIRVVEPLQLRLPKQRRLLDMFSESLLFVNNLYNSHYGFVSRKVLAHTPHFISKTIMEDLQQKFRHEYEVTSSHKTRQENDMQFAFAYFYFLMGEKRKKSLSEIFDEFDTDVSGTWSDREIRTFLSRTNPNPPLHLNYVLEFNEDVVNCSKTVTVPSVTTPLYERYADSNLPTVSKDLVMNCPLISKRLLQFESVDKYNYKVESSENYIHFKMISSNVSTVVKQLEDVRKEPRKFVCLNNNLDPHGTENEIVHALIEDSFRATLPIPSQFELPLNYRNRFLYMSELNEWREWRNFIRAFVYACVASLIVLTIVNFFSAEIEAMKRRWCIRRRRREKLEGINI